MFRRSPIGPVLRSFVEQARRRIWIASPFVTGPGASLATSSWAGVRNIDARLIARLNERDILAKVLDLDALESFITAGAEVRVRNASFHAKVFIVDDEAIVGSGNLTSGGLFRNEEAAVVIAATSAAEWFEDLWLDGDSKPLPIRELRRIGAEVAEHIASMRPESLAPFGGEALKDFADLLPPAASAPSRTIAAPYGWLKLNGVSSGPNQVPSDYSSFDEHKIVGAQCFGVAKRPDLQAGDVVFLAMLYRKRNGRSGRALYGRGVVDMPYRPGVDDMPDEIAADPRIVAAGANRWPRIVWLRDIDIARGRMEDLPQLDELVDGTGQLALDPARFRQGGRFKLKEDERSALDAVFDAELSQHIGFAVPIGSDVWWNRFLDADQRVTRFDLERRARPL